MGIILKQSLKNTLVIYTAFLIGGINTLVFYPQFLGAEYYGMIVVLLSASNLIMPFIAFGVQHSIVKFFSTYNTKEQKDRFLSISIVIPLLFAFVIGAFWNHMHYWIMSKIAKDNENIENYTHYIYFIAVCCAYFEFFYGWAKVHLQTVFGNLLKELWNRITITLLLVVVGFKMISPSEFIYALTAAYALRTLIMMGYAFSIYLPRFSTKLPDNYLEIIKYLPYIVIAGSAGALLLDIDKVMIPGKESIHKAAYYTVAVFIGSFIEAPGRAMMQILQPLTSISLNQEKLKEMEQIYKQSSINLLVIGGLFFVLVNCGVHELFKLMPEKGYAGGELVVLMISLVKLYSMFLGTNGAIINNSKFYKVVLPIGVGMAISAYVLNSLFYFNLELGTNGLALATLLTMFFFNSFKLWFVKQKFSITPFTTKTVPMLLIIIGVLGAFYFWNFSFHPIYNIILKSILIVLSYLFLVMQFGISKELTTLFAKLYKTNS
ncbi:lipopolysaccharide biosynthesis protein [Tenacibaculum maritimum]|uniref:lipopolysaccharide biosynthesis protein n=1 Tax=Tenacibaculum maritimum TaxID=107401 RepID=UPI0012E49BAC|nr:lipopolysaccharide biosynthesis protein [Tenacibaculum maritimum]CAA0198095.1 Polysaccharide biosynthesis protein [Tenacibaculum maritimum]